jgi:hypothetical protein
MPQKLRSVFHATVHRNAPPQLALKGRGFSDLDKQHDKQHTCDVGCGPCCLPLKTLKQVSFFELVIP